MRPIDRFIAYRKAREACAVLYALLRRWRSDRDLVDQGQRAATSVTFNLSEGTSRPRGSPDRVRYYRMALGSALELEALLDAALDRGLEPPEQILRARLLFGEVARILTTIITNT